ncbi:MAG: phosphoglycerate mutase family protein [Candidatus Shapirobacteria bacterium]
MKIYFVRHGEAMDDIRDEYGGWHDPELSPKGIEQANEAAKKLKLSGITVEKILSSPLVRATQTAESFAIEFGVPVEKCVYLKERNTYGLLCGVNKTEAKEKYPELVLAYDEGKEVLGYEEYDFFVKRVKALIEYLGKINQDVIAVTHGKMLGAILTEIIGKKPVKIGDSCVIEMDLSEDNLTLVNSEGVEF